MTETPVPETLDARKIFTQQTVVKGGMPLRQFKRFTSLLVDDSGDLEIELHCFIDESRHRIIAGGIETGVKVRCQRCLEIFRMTLKERFQLAVVASEAIAERLPEEIDPWISEEPLLSLSDILEEQLILAMPIVSRHAEGLCEAAQPENQDSADTGGNAAEQRSEEDNPFAVLKQLKKDH